MPVVRELVEGIAGAEPVVLDSGHALADERSVGWTAVTEFLARTSRGGARPGPPAPPPPPARRRPR
uniref:hypothetical protein n=1 Tax=Nocardia farcinica TaxID=37329 RepID=UPI002454CAE0